MSVVALPPPAQAPQRGWLEGWLDASSTQRSPERFRLWAGIGAISGAAERRVWTEGLSSDALYPNLFIFLVGPAGVGKSQGISKACDLLRLAGFHAPNDITKQSLLDHLAEKGKRDLIVKGETLSYSFAALMIDELSNFMSEYNPEIANALTQLYNCLPTYEETRRTVEAAGLIHNPGVSLVAGTTTKNLGSTIPHELWGQGFMTRVLLIYSEEPVRRSAFGTFEGDNPATRVPARAWKRLQTDLERIADLRGPMVWDFAAQTAFDDWIMRDECAPAPTHPKLAEYNTRRWMQIAKLSMISALSDFRLHVLLKDVERAKGWLFEAEVHLPRLFETAGGSADSSILDEFHEWALREYERTKRALPAIVLMNWFRKRVGAGAARLLDLAERAGLIDREAGASGLMARYVPKRPEAR